MTLEEALESLGSTPEEVADELRDHGIQGCQEEAKSCPISKYLKSLGFQNVSVSDNLVIADKDGQTLVKETPYPVSEFINEFDAGYYEDLIEEF